MEQSEQRVGKTEQSVEQKVEQSVDQSVERISGRTVV